MAPPHGLYSWLQGEKRELAELRGKVVVLHTFAWNCDSCIRKGIPLSVELQAAIAPLDLAVISMTTPAMTENTLKVVAEHGMSQPIALANPGGETSPYVNMGNGFTYMWIVGRNGELVWRGDPSTKEEEFLAAMQLALADRDDRTLRGELHPMLATAAGSFARGKYGEAAKLAASLQKKHARKKDDDSQAIASGAAHLLERIDESRVALLAALEESASLHQPLEFTRVYAELKNGFPKDKAVVAALGTASQALDDDVFSAAVEVARDWDGLLRNRPALYGVRHDKAAKRYRKDLLGFLKTNGEGPYAAEASVLVALGEVAEERG